MKRIEPGKALSGVRVIEFCEVAAGPYAGMLLADMGAEVIKVERPQGDAMRMWPPFNGDYSENFASLNRGKKSVVLDMKAAADRAAARALILTGDVVVENFRPGVMDRNGIGYASFHAEHPALVYCSISAFGQTGPRAGQGGFDLTMQAMAAVMSVTGEVDGAPVKCGVPLCDFVSGLYAAMAVSAALREAEAAGVGQHIDVSMFGATLAVGALQVSEFFGSGKDPRKLGSAHPRNAPYQAFAASDGHFGMAAGNNKLWQSVCKVVEMPELLTQARFDSPTHRASNQAELRDILEKKFRLQPVAFWLSAFAAEGVPCSPINTYSQALADPQVTHMQWVQSLTLPSGAVTRTFASALRINDQPIPIGLRPPALGEHTVEVLASLIPPADEGQTPEPAERCSTKTRRAHVQRP